MNLQTMGEMDVCSSISNIDEHEKFKKLTKDDRIKKLQEVYDTYGVRSNEFFVQVKPFILWGIHKSIRSIHYTYIEDLVNNAYEELIIAFEGGNTTHYNKEVYKKPIYGTPKYYRKYNNIGTFILQVVTSSVTKFSSKNFRRTTLHEDNEKDISDRLGYTDFEMDNNLTYSSPEDGYQEPIFQFFKLNDKLKQHLAVMKETCPRNNVLYNFMLWREHK